MKQNMHTYTYLAGINYQASTTWQASRLHKPGKYNFSPSFSLTDWTSGTQLVGHIGPAPSFTENQPLPLVVLPFTLLGNENKLTPGISHQPAAIIEDWFPLSPGLALHWLGGCNGNARPLVIRKQELLKTPSFDGCS